MMRIQAHANTHTFFLTQYACRRTLSNLVSFLRQILGWNSICWGDELCDRVEREETRMKGQEKMRSRVDAPGLIVYYNPALFLLSFLSLSFTMGVCVVEIRPWMTCPLQMGQQ